LINQAAQPQHPGGEHQHHRQLGHVDALVMIRSLAPKRIPLLGRRTPAEVAMVPVPHSRLQP